MSFKNQLQEHYQKQKLPLPIYSSVRDTSSKDHEAMWISTVTLPEGEKFTSSSQSKKTVAECEAAEKALEYLAFLSETKLDCDDGRNNDARNITTTNVVDFSPFSDNEYLKKVKNGMYEKIILIDLENRPDFINVKRMPEDTIIIGVIGHCHALATKECIFPKYMIKSAVKDAADHGLSFLAGILSQYIPVTTDVYIVSRDHYAEATVSCLSDAISNMIVYKPNLTCEQLFSLDE